MQYHPSRTRLKHLNLNLERPVPMSAPFPSTLGTLSTQSGHRPPGPPTSHQPQPPAQTPPPAALTQVHQILAHNISALNLARLQIETSLAHLRQNAQPLTTHRVHVLILIQDLERALTRLNSVVGSLEYHRDTPTQPSAEPKP